MESKNSKQKVSFVKKKAEPALGYRTPDFLKQSKFSNKSKTFQGKFNPSHFRTQHKGG